MAFACVVVLSSCASQPVAPDNAASQLPAAYVSEQAPLGNYRIGARDLLQVKIFQVEDLDREVRVNNQGYISLPLIGDMQVAGRSAIELQQEIAARYGARYLQNPQVSVFIKEYSSQRVTVDGAVKKSGIYPIASRLSLLQSIALAEGLSDVANEHNVVVFRSAEGKRLVARFDLTEIRAGRAADPEIMAQDVIVVDKSRSEVWLKRFVQIAPVLSTWMLYSTR